MIIYLIKSSLCLVCLMAFYKWVLAPEKVFSFNRWYLLSILFIASSIPWVVVAEKPMHPNAHFIFSQTVETSTIKQSGSLFWEIAIGGVYGLGVLFFLIKFGLQLIGIYRAIHSNTVIKEGQISLVLLNNREVPHSFFNYIFINQKDYKNKRKGSILLAHEKAHCAQKHSFDVLLLELIRVFLWFHPFVYILKKYIKTNHEFLADAEVMKQNIDPIQYQKLVLSFVNQNPKSLCSAFNYLLTKKRFIMIAKKNKNRWQTTKQFAVVPLVVVLLFLFGKTALAQTEQVLDKELQEYKTLFEKSYDSEKGFRINKKTANRMAFLYKNMSDSQREKISELGYFIPPPPPSLAPPPPPPPPVSYKEADFYYLNGKPISKEKAIKIIENTHVKKKSIEIKKVNDDKEVVNVYLEN